MVRLAYILALALLLALCGGTMFRPGGWEQSAAWAGAPGIVLHYDVYDAKPADYDWHNKLPNEQGLDQAVRDWAQAIQIQFSDTGQIDTGCWVGLVSAGASGGVPDAVTSHGYDVLLVGVTAGERDDLIARLAPLAGVAPPAMTDYAQYEMYFGVPEAQLAGPVLINGVTYSFPQDFSVAEASVLVPYVRYGQDYTRYCAFLQLSGGPEPTADRFNLGDVVKLERDASGVLVITTLAQVWDEGRVLRNDPLFQERLGQRGNSSWSVAISRTLPEPGYDPLAALAAVGDHREQQAHSLDFPHLAASTYQFLSAERLLKPGAPKYAADEAAQAKALVAQLDSALDAFQLSHPQYWNKYQHRYRVQHSCSYFGAMPLAYQVHVADADGALAQEVQALLVQVPGLPEAQVTERDLKVESEKIILQPPPQDESFTLPPLPPPNAAQWHAMEGYKLNYRVLGRMQDAQRYYGETDATRGFSHALAQWATTHSVPVNPRPTPVPQPVPLGPSGAPASVLLPGSMPFNTMRFPDVALYTPEPGGGGQFDRFSEAVFTLYFAAVEVATVDSLSAALEALPGVAAPQVEACRFYVHDSHPDQPVTGGDLLVDGKRYRFPDDFAWEEALGLSYRWSQPGKVQYAAFYTLVDPKRNRIKFPDVARCLKLADGSLALTTFKQDWPEGRKLLALRPNVYGGATAELPSGVDESGFDPLPALTKRLAYTQPAVDGSSVYHLIYYIVPQEQWLEAYKLADSAQIATRQEVCAEVDRRLEAYLIAHPEYKQTDTTWQRIGWSGFPYTGQALGLDVFVYGDDDALARELAALLADIPDLPAPVQTQEEITTW
jgi:hypothetical protein